MIEDVISDKFSIYRNIFLNTAITTTNLTYDPVLCEIYKYNYK